MGLNTSSSENRKQPSRVRSSVFAGARRHRAEVVEQARVGVELLVLVLGEVVGLRVVPQDVLARGDGLLPGEDLDQRGFARAVHAHQRDAVAALDHEARRRENTRASP